MDVAQLEPLLQRTIAAADRVAAAHIVLCAGPFERLAASKPLIVPHTEAVHRLTAVGAARLAVVVPFRGQAAAAERKWRRSGFSCRTFALDDTEPVGMPEGSPVGEPERLATRLRSTDADVVVVDYVGLPAPFLEATRSLVTLDVFDLGETAATALLRTIDTIEASRIGHG